jgi:polar amino acid transport system permease protein
MPSTSMNIAEWFRQLYDRDGINLSYMYDSFDRARLLHGLLLTLELAVTVIVLSVLIGIGGAWFQGSKRPVVQRLVAGFVSIFRNTPPLVQLYFMYFGLGHFLTIHTDDMSTPLLSSFQWALLSLALFGGAFNIEIFRSGIESVGIGVKEASYSLGLSPWKAFLLVIFPIALRNCLPALGNNLVELTKTTSLAYAIAVPEMMYNAKQIWGDSSNVTEMMITVLLLYVILTTALAALFGILERSLELPGLRRRAN